MAKTEKFGSIVEVIERFSDEKKCREHLAQMRWNGEAKCPYCNHAKIYKYADHIRYKCSKCRQIFTVTVGTVFENSKISLRKWFLAIYTETCHKKGISSHQLGRDIGVTQKTAWFMLHRIRLTFKSKFSKKLFGLIEADETVVGGLEKNKHAHRKTKGTQGRSTKVKSAVIGIIKRGGEVRVATVQDVGINTLHAFIKENVHQNSLICTDEWRGYNGLAKQNFNHLRINHSKGQYARGIAHTNSIENFWSQLQRGIVGIYHSVSRKHLHRYCESFVFRYNTRKINQRIRFDVVLSQCNIRLKYNELIAAA